MERDREHEQHIRRRLAKNGRRFTKADIEQLLAEIDYLREQVAKGMEHRMELKRQMVARTPANT